MAERYDIIAPAGDGVFPLVAAPEGKSGLARALLIELSRNVGTVDSFVATDKATLPPARTDTELTADLGGNMFWALFISDIALAVGYARRSTTKSTELRCGAEDVLAERFARGEIDENEYLARLTVIKSHAQY